MMKKLITMIICLAIVSGVSAQEKRHDFEKRGQSEFTSSAESRNCRIKSNDKKKFTIGAKAGLNLSNAVGTNGNDLDTKSKVGFHIGVVSEFNAGNGVAIAPEIVFSTQGFRVNVVSENAITEGSVNINYINIPIMAKFYIVDCFSVDVGPQVGFVTGVKIKAGEESNKVNSDEYNVFDFGLGVGLAYNFNQKFFASARYNIGITDFIQDLNKTNSVFQFSVGYNFFGCN